MKNVIKSFALTALSAAVLVGCGGGGGGKSNVDEGPVKKPGDFFGADAVVVAGYEQCVFTPKDTSNAEAEQVAKDLNNHVYPATDFFKMICPDDQTAKLINISDAIKNNDLVVRRIGTTDYLVVEFNGSEDRLIIKQLDPDLAEFLVVDAEAKGFEFTISLGQVDNARSDGRVDIISAHAIIQRENSQIEVKSDGTIDLTPEGESNRFVDVLMIDDGGSQDWFANSADDLFEFVKITDTKNRQYVNYLLDGVEYSQNMVDMLLTYSYSTNGHENGITGAYYKYRDDFEFDEGDVTVKTMLKNMQTRIAIDGAGNASGVIKEFIAYNANQGEDQGQVLVRIYNRDPNASMMRMAVSAMSGTLSTTGYVEDGTLLEEVMQNYNVTPVDLDDLMSQVEPVAMEGDMLL